MQSNSKKKKVINVRPVKMNDKEWITLLLSDEWASTRVVTRGKMYNVENLPGFIAVYKNKKVGLLTYNIINDECEIITLNSLKENIGVGTVLLRAIEDIAILNGCNRLWVITTNDNTKALHFYQMKGFKIKAIYPDAIKESRCLKPEIPLLGIDNIEIRDEIELEKKLKN